MELFGSKTHQKKRKTKEIFSQNLTSTLQLMKANPGDCLASWMEFLCK